MDETRFAIELVEKISEMAKTIRDSYPEGLRKDSHDYLELRDRGKMEAYLEVLILIAQMTQ